MPQAVSMGCMREYAPDTIDKAFLTIGKYRQSMWSLKSSRMGLFDDDSEFLEVPEPIIVVFNVDDGISERK